MLLKDVVANLKYSASSVTSRTLLYGQYLVMETSNQPTPHPHVNTRPPSVHQTVVLQPVALWPPQADAYTIRLRYYRNGMLQLLLPDCIHFG